VAIHKEVGIHGEDEGVVWEPSHPALHKSQSNKFRPMGKLARTISREE
jgi:hypothetical protein